MTDWSFTAVYEDALELVDDAYRDPERFVPATGNLDASVMLIGEAPGADEVKQGKPFVGRAGQRLDDILHEICVDRSDLYISNLVKTRPPSNRDPTRDEIDAWKPVLDAEIKEVDPDTILTLGNFATKELTGTSKGITQIRGKPFHRHERTIIPTFHPAATLYDQSKRPALKEDLMHAFGETESGQKGLEDF